MVWLREVVRIFFNDTATTEIYTLSLHDALPIFYRLSGARRSPSGVARWSVVNDDSQVNRTRIRYFRDRKSTRLNSSHANISYAVFCLKKNKYSNLITALRALIGHPAACVTTSLL